MMSEKSPLYPVYRAASEQSKESTAGFIDTLKTIVETKDSSSLNTLRTSIAQQLSGIALPEINYTTQEVSGGPDNVKVKITILRPVNSEKEVLPIIMFLHGGGFIVGGFYSHGKPAIDLSITVRAIVVFVHYSLSPEVQFPVATEEIYAALCWVQKNAPGFNGNPEKIVVFGDSTGGNLAAVVSLMAKDRGLGGVIKGQVLLYPFTSPHKDYSSYKIYGDGENILPAKFIEYIQELYYPKPLAEMENPYATPLIATLEQLSNLPPALIVTAECDVMRDEGEAYGNKLIEAGVDVLSIRVLNTTHGFMTFLGPVTPQYISTLRTVVSFIKGHLGVN